MSAASPGEYPLTESEKAELKRRTREAEAEMDKIDSQVRSDSAYDVLARAGMRLTGGGEDPDEARRDLLRIWTEHDLQVMVAIASRRLTRQAWDEMDPDERWKLFRPRGFSAWEQSQGEPVMSGRRRRRVRCASEPAALVRCDCGTEMVVSHADLLSGRVTCCGQCGDRIPGHRCGSEATEATS